MKLEVNIAPFPVPTTVQMVMPPQVRQAGFKTPPELPLSELDREAFDGMCTELLTGLNIEYARQRDLKRQRAILDEDPT